MKSKIPTRRLLAIGLAGLLTTAAGIASASAAPRTLSDAPAVPGSSHSLLSNANTSIAKADPENAELELGLRFKVASAGTLDAVRFLKAPGDVDTHRVSIWNAKGKLLASATSTSESASGWQSVQLAKPLTIKPGTYTASFHSNRYMATNSYFTKTLASGPLSARANAGVYAYGTTKMPTSTYKASNYWVDVIFTAGVSSAPPTTAPTTTPPTTTPSTTTPPTTVPPTTAPPTTKPPTTVPPAPSGEFPNASNTGVPAGVQLTAYTGKCDIHEDNVVIDSKIVTCGGMLIYGKNLVVRNSVVDSALMTNSAVASIRVEDSEIRGGKTSWGALDGDNITVLRSEVTGGQHSVHCGSNCLVQDSFLHDQWNDPNASFHNNAFISNGGSNIVVRHNTLHCTPVDNSNDGGCTADLSLFGDFAPVANVTVDANLFKGTPGGYCGTFGHNPAKPYGSKPTGVVVTNNVFEVGSGKCGGFGPVTSFDASGAGNVWTGNRWVDGSPLTSVDD